MLETERHREWFPNSEEKNFQPRIQKLANLSSKCENNILRHAKSQKGDGCRADIVINLARREQGRASMRKLGQAEEVNIKG